MRWIPIGVQRYSLPLTEQLTIVGDHISRARQASVRAGARHTVVMQSLVELQPGSTSSRPHRSWRFRARMALGNRAADDQYDCGRSALGAGESLLISEE